MIPEDIANCKLVQKEGREKEMHLFFINELIFEFPIDNAINSLLSKVRTPKRIDKNWF